MSLSMDRKCSVWGDCSPRSKGSLKVPDRPWLGGGRVTRGKRERVRGVMGGVRGDRGGR